MNWIKKKWPEKGGFTLPWRNTVESFSIFGVKVEKRGCIIGFNFAVPE